MESIDFKSLSERLRTELSRVYFWQKIVRILSIIVYLFVFCWMMFVLFGGLSCWIHRIRELQCGYAITFSRFYGIYCAELCIQPLSYEIPRAGK